VTSTNKTHAFKLTTLVDEQIQRRAIRVVHVLEHHEHRLGTRCPSEEVCYRLLQAPVVALWIVGELASRPGFVPG
jgi:hypothetical protein